MDQTPRDREHEKAVPEVPALDASRRALLRGGVAAAPVLLTLVSRPVSAGTTCVVASSFVSVATFHSRNPNATSVQCTTRTCQDWYNQACLSPSGNPSRPSYLNNSVASLLGSAGSMYDQAALWFVLQNFPYGITTSGQMGVLQHLTSLCLNVQKGYAPLPGNINTAYLQAIWKNYIGNGGMYKLPSSGINWDSTAVVSWLRMLMYPIAL